MAIEQDKTNTAVVATMLAIGAAAMVGGSAALVALARGEIRDYSQESEGYADISSVTALKAEQRQRLSSAKLPIDQARAQVLSDLKRDPSTASPPPAVSAAEPAVSGTVDPAGSATAPGSSAPQGAESGAAGTAPAGSAPTTPSTGAPGVSPEAPKPQTPPATP